MARVEAARRYDVPVERGFAFITDTANWSKFCLGAFASSRVKLGRER